MKSRRYTNKNSRTDTLKFSGGKMNNLKHELLERVNQNLPTRVIRSSKYFKLTLDKSEGLYTVLDLKSSKSTIIAKQEVVDLELALVNIQEFNETCKSLL